MKTKHSLEKFLGGGNSLKGYINATYHELVEMYGEPNGICGDGKSKCIWNFITSDGVVFSIYDWKMYDTDKEDITLWNIAGNNSKSVDVVREDFPLALVTHQRI